MPSHYGALEPELPETHNLLQGVQGKLPEYYNMLSDESPADYTSLTTPMDEQPTLNALALPEGPGQLQESAEARQARRARQLPMQLQQLREEHAANLRLKLLKAKQRAALVAGAAANARLRPQRAVIAEKQPEVPPQLQPTEEFVGPSRPNTGNFDADQLVQMVYRPMGVDNGDFKVDSFGLKQAQEALEQLPPEKQNLAAKKFNEYAAMAQKVREKRKKIADLAAIAKVQNRARRYREMMQRAVDKQKALAAAGDERRKEQAAAAAKLEQEAAQRNLAELQHKLDEEDADRREAAIQAAYYEAQKKKLSAREREDVAVQSQQALAKLQAERAERSEKAHQQREQSQAHQQLLQQRSAAARDKELETARSFRSRLEQQLQAGASHPAYSTPDPQADAAYAKGVLAARRQRLAAARESTAPNPVPMAQKVAKARAEVATQEAALQRQRMESTRMTRANAFLRHQIAQNANPPPPAAPTPTPAPPSHTLTIRRTRPLPTEQLVVVSSRPKKKAR